jgi:hypothetical protein
MLHSPPERVKGWMADWSHVGFVSALKAFLRPAACLLRIRSPKSQGSVSEWNTAPGAA